MQSPRCRLTRSRKPNEAAAFAERVVILPGYGMAVAQAQAQARHKIWELTPRVTEHGVKVKLAIRPVAGACWAA